MTPDEAVEITQSKAWNDPHTREQYANDTDFMEALAASELGPFFADLLSEIMGDQDTDEFVADLASRFEPGFIPGVVKCMECRALVEDEDENERAVHAATHVTETYAFQALAKRIEDLAIQQQFGSFAKYLGGYPG